MIYFIIIILYLAPAIACLVYMVNDRISEGGNAIASVHLSIGLFPFYLQNRLTIDLELLHVSGS